MSNGEEEIIEIDVIEESKDKSNEELMTVTPEVVFYGTDTSSVLGIEFAEALANLEDNPDKIELTPFGLPKYREDPITKLPVLSKDYAAERGFDVYMPGDDNFILSKLDTRKKIKGLQTKLEDAGYLEDGSYTKEIRDRPTVLALQNLLADANTEGMDWELLLNDLLTNPVYDTTELPDEPELDYAELSEKVFNTVKSVVGRNPTDSEMEVLTGILAGYKQEEFESNINNLIMAARPKYVTKKSVEIDEKGFERPVTLEGQVSKLPEPEFTAVENSEAKFASKVREMFKPEMDLNQRREQTRNVANIIKSSVAGLRSIGG